MASSTDRGAVLEDLGYGNAIYWSGPDAPIHALWDAITMPALVLRARQEILPGFGFILPAAEAERFAAAVPSARVAEIDANHYTIITHDDPSPPSVRSCARADAPGRNPWDGEPEDQVLRFLLRTSGRSRGRGPDRGGGGWESST